MLYIVPTPIGNLKDITLRALEVLQSVNGIICEDSRHSSILLNNYQIKKPMIVLNDFNEVRVFPKIIEQLRAGQNLALVSDAGTPLVSDPGYKLVRECLAKGIEVDSLPGPSSVITALTLSGLPPDKFLFLGYLPEKPGHRQKIYTQISDISKKCALTFIIFIAPHKLIKVLTEMQEIFEDVEICLAKELSKVHQQVETKTISNWLEQFNSKAPKGEYVLLFRI